MRMSALADTVGLGALGKSAEGLPQSKMLLDILKKLYKKNVDLVKENQILKQQLSATKKRLIETECSQRKLTGAGAGVSGSKSETKNQLKSSISKLRSSVKSREVRRREDNYNTSVTLQREPLQKRKVDSQINAGKLVNELNFRLGQEQKQRDLETAVYNAQIYEYEKKEVDWFVEKKYLEEKITSLEEEAQKRNVLDDQIESCIQLLCQKMKA